jgi:hypothetical protein
MMAFFIEGRGGALGSAGARSILVACALALAVLASPNSAAAADIGIVVDQAKLVKLPDRVATLVIGNPLIADAAIQSGGLMVITGKGYGSTNIIALDRGGVVVMEKTIEVVPASDVVVVYRGINQETYSCVPICEPRITLGDSTRHFQSAIGQTTTRSSLAQGEKPDK